MTTVLYHPKWEELRAGEEQREQYGVLRKENKRLRMEYSKLEFSVREWAKRQAREQEEKVKLREERERMLKEKEKAEREKRVAEEEMLKAVEGKGKAEDERAREWAARELAVEKAKEMEASRKVLLDRVEELKGEREKLEQELAKVKEGVPPPSELEELRRLRGQADALRQAMRDFIQGGAGGGGVRVEREEVKELRERLEAVEEVLRRTLGKRPAVMQEEGSWGPCDTLRGIVTLGGGEWVERAVAPPQATAQHPSAGPAATAPAELSPVAASDSADDGVFLPGEVSLAF